MTKHTTRKKIDLELITPPVFTLTENAMNQLKLMLENDFTLAGKYFRVLISGKGCEGFTYSVGFTDKNKDDLSIRISQDDDLEIIVDSFAAFYLGDTQIDYILDIANNNEGFVVTNLDQKKYYGKFWRKREDLVPPLINQ